MRTQLSHMKIVLGICLFVCTGALAWAQEYSHVRIVRLSFEEGTVNLTRPNVAGMQEASVNTPIQEGFSLSTVQGSFAEVEFENTSTARIGQFTQLDFPQLAMDPNGNKLNGMELRQGYATFTIHAENADMYELRAAQLTVTPAIDKDVTFRVDVDGVNVRVEVFKGVVDVAGIFGSQRLGKNDVLEYDPGEDEPLHITHGIIKDAWDQWVEQREQEAQLARRKSPPNYYTNQLSSLLYGWNDLYYYGNWSYLPGYGNCWIPVVNPGWVPYSYGQWVWYPGFGYTWISFEPWGWVPFHYGNWYYSTGVGWVWVPGGFNYWSPALVDWYQGQNWVAWSPRPLRPRPGGGPSRGQPGCPDTGCVVAVSTQTFNGGLPVQGHRLPGVNVSDGDAVGAPRIAATAGVPGIHAHGSSGSRPGAAPATAPSRSGFGRAGDSTEGRVVYDPAEGRFVNGRDSVPARPAPTSAAPTPAPAATPAPARTRPRPSAPSASGEPAAGTVSSSGSTLARTPAPRSGPVAQGSHHASPRTGVATSRPTSTFDRMLNSWSVGNSRGGRSYSSGTSRSSSGSWSAPASSGGGSSGGTSGSSSSAPVMSSGGGGRSVGGGGGARSPGGHGTPAIPHR